MSRKRRRLPSRTPVRHDYLRTLGHNIDAALDLIVHDIVSTGALTADEAVPAVRIHAAFRLDDDIANGAEPQADETAVWVAEAMQHDFFEGLGMSDRLVTWPPCPDHPNHPLWLRSPDERSARSDDERPADPVWMCTATGQAIAELGQL